jgi:iron complex transport system ATP-binding protein
MSLSVSNLRVAYDARILIDDLSIVFEPGELVGLVGPNGAGKTTLLRHLAGLRHANSGQIRLDGRDVAALEPAERGRIIGYMPQHFEPAWDYTSREIVELGASRSSTGASRFNAMAQEHELTDLLDRRWSRLSGGERARTLLAAVLVADPAVLLADEPGAELDIRHRLELLHRLRAITSNRILIVVMHDLEMAIRHCGRMVVLHRGRVAIDGPARMVGNDPTLDTIFETAFQRVPIDSAGGPLLPQFLEEPGRSIR